MSLIQKFITPVGEFFGSLISCLPKKQQAQIQKFSPLGNKLPQQIHQKIYFRKQFPSKNRVIIVGDIHGCCDEFEDLLSKCNYNKIFDQLILVGDLVNKGTKSIEVLKKSREFEALMVRGNHDDAILAAHHNPKNKNPKKNKKFQLSAKLTSEDVEFLEKSPFTLTLPEMGVIIVHAGIVPNVPLEKQKMDDMYKMRNIMHAYNNQNNKNNSIFIGSEDDTKGLPWVKFWNGPQHVIFGHNAKRDLQLGDFFTGLDGGCCYGRKLFAMVFDIKKIDEKILKKGVRRENLNSQIISVQARQMYEVPKHLQESEG